MSTEAMGVSVIIPNWNNVALLVKCLDSLVAQSVRPQEIIVVDNGSEDGSAALVAEKYPHVRLVVNPVNRGFCAAVNQGVELADGPLLLILNNDTELDRGALEKMARVLAAAPDSVLGVFPKVVFADEPCVVNSLGVVWNRVELWRDMRVGQVDFGQHDSSETVFGSIFATVMVRAGAFRSIGAFDEKHFSYGEDFDVCYRANAFGYSFLTVPSSLVRHRHRASSNDKSDPEWAYYFYLRNYLYVVLKNYELWSLARRGPSIFWRFWGKGALGSLYRRDRRRFATHLRAAYGLVCLAREIVCWRAFVRCHRVRRDKAIWDRAVLPSGNPYYYEDAVVLGDDVLCGYSQAHE